MARVVEHFDGGSLPSPWSAITGGTGTITVSDSGVVGELAATSDSAAIVRAFDHTTDAIYWWCASARYNGATGPTPWPAMRLMHSASTPVAGARASFTIVAQHTYYNTGGVTYDRINWSIDPSGTNQQWQESSQSWATGGTVISAPAGTEEGDYRLYGMQWDATNSRVRWLYGHTSAGSAENADYGPRIVTVTDWVSLSSILNGTSSTLWMVLGWPENNFYTNNCSFHIEWFSEQTGPLIHAFCNGKASVGAGYNITHHVGHDLRAPFFVPGTRAQIAIDKGTAGAWDDVDTQWGSAILAADGKYVQSYAGDGGSTVITIGIASATSPYGPWTKYAGNPVIPLTPATDYSAYCRFNVLVEDWQETDAAKRYKLLVNANDGTTNRTLLFYAADYVGPYTFDGRLLEDDGTETGIAFRGQPIFENGVWYLLYNATVGGANVVRYATCPTLRAGQATKANVTLNTQGVGAVEVTLTAVSGRVWTCADTTGLVKDMKLVCTKTASADTYDLTTVRKVISGTQFEVYHTAPGAAVGTVCRSANYGTDNALNHVIRIDGVWHYVMTVFKSFTSHGSYSAHHETNGLFVGGASLTDPMAIDWMATPIAPLGRDAWNTTVSNENMRIVHSPQRFAQGGGTLALSLGLAGSGTVAAGGITGTGALPLSLGLAGAGTVEVQGTGALPLSLGLAGAGTVEVQGTGALPLSLGLAGAGTVEVQGTGALPLVLGLAGAGVVGSAPIAGTGALPLVLGLAGAGTVEVRGVGALPLVVGLAGAGTVAVQGTGALPLVLGLAGAGVVGSAPIAGTGALPLVLGLAGAGTVEVRGGGALALALGLAGGGTVEVQGVGALPLVLGLSGEGVVGSAPIAGTGALPLVLGLAGAGTVDVRGAGVLALGLGLSGAGVLGIVPISGTGTLGLALVLNGAGTVAGVSVIRLVAGLGSVVRGAHGAAVGLRGGFSGRSRSGPEA